MASYISDQGHQESATFATKGARKLKRTRRTETRWYSKWVLEPRLDGFGILGEHSWLRRRSDSAQFTDMGVGLAADNFHHFLTDRSQIHNGPLNNSLPPPHTDADFGPEAIDC